ncbi:MAG: hypothetical protein IK012_09545 [Fibrobacter sp.]|uniref:hypothetical protein n=1 Tax=Fibrobacter sp. TaxID=35828 RepID=UPI0025BF943F|nr:hypothetical protein [Fibrobacter sp.]MBR4785477.1 hypothetical protein [Fibrobacter sp.]
MKIEKRKITGEQKFSVATKSAIAATLGMAALFSLNACDDTASAGREEPLGGDMPPEDVIPPASSDSPDTGTSSSEAASPATSSETAGPETSSETVTPSSSSKIVDIPLSHEPVSSSVAEAISSLMESSSSETAPTSSAIAPESSSNIVPPSSSSRNGWTDWGDPSSSSENLEEVCPPNDARCFHIHMCDNPNGCYGASMVTTFERDDIEA